MIRNYNNPEGTISLLDSTNISSDVKLVYTSTTTGAAIGGGVTGQTNAITTIALCNTSAQNLTDVTDNSVTVNIYVVKSGKTPTAGNLVVSELTVPAGETVFLSEERLVLDSGDEIHVGTSSSGKLAVTISSLPV